MLLISTLLLIIIEYYSLFFNKIAWNTISPIKHVNVVDSENLKTNVNNRINCVNSNTFTLFDWFLKLEVFINNHSYVTLHS